MWPWINLSGYAEAEIERAGLSALDRGEISKAVKRLETAAHMRGAPARAWYNLGIAYHRQNRYDHALVAYEQAAKMPDATSEFQQSAKEMRTYWNNLKPFEK